MDAEIVGDESAGSNLPESVSRLVERARALPVPVLAVATLIVVGGSGGAILYGDDIISWING